MAYQSEAELELQFIEQLRSQKYDAVEIPDYDALVENFKTQFEKFNAAKLDHPLTDKEWERVFNLMLGKSVFQSAKILRDKFVLEREDGTKVYLAFFDNDHTKNIFQVTHQTTVVGKYVNRYDVTLLVNGLPLIQVELKRRGIDIREAVNQVMRYKKHSYNGLYHFVQLFIVSNGVDTKYFANSDRDLMYSLAFFWTDFNNVRITNLKDFSISFLARDHVIKMLTRYTIINDTDKILMVMRPYQVYAVEALVRQATLTNRNAYIWHTTGAGKTLTSFKTAQILASNPNIKKVIFLVDRKDLDSQTTEEFNKFEAGSVDATDRTDLLVKQMQDKNRQLIITTIQKMSNAVKNSRYTKIMSSYAEEKVVFIIDECHRSQFGDMHIAIVKSFKKYHLFGFTGTPIFAVNANNGYKHINLKTTEQAFGDKLHTYTIVDAINDKNVLPFRVDYIKTMEAEPDIDDKQVADIDREKAFLASERIGLVTGYILNHFNQKTYRNEKSYTYNSLINIAEVASAKDRNKVEEVKQKLRLSGFNSIFCVSSVEAAKLYYNEFKRQMAENPSKKLKIATIYSYGANECIDDSLLDEENSEDTSFLDKSSRDFLEDAIKDYNEMFKTNYDTSSDKFQNYYKDVSLRMKNREIDLLIVVNMFLTGFDATTLNTLWVDKNLKAHGLIQAFSRTNRILNSIKTFGNIVCFRNLQKRTDDAIALFGDKEAGGICILKGYKDYFFGYTDENGNHKQGYIDLVRDLEIKYPLSEPQIIGEKAQKDFIGLFGSILRMRNLLSSFDEFTGNELLSEGEMQDYLSRYNDLYLEWKKYREEHTKEDITDDIVFEVELIKQVEINIDYILLLVKKYHDSHCEDKEVLISINKAVDSSLELRSKKALIETFIAGINDVDDIMLEWKDFVLKQKELELSTIIAEMQLNDKETRKFIDYSFRDGVMKTTGTDIDKIMPPMSRFGGSGRGKKKLSVIERLKQFFERFFGIV